MPSYAYGTVINTINLQNVKFVVKKASLFRSATLVGCYLMAVNNWTPEQAVNHMKVRFLCIGKLTKMFFDMLISYTVLTVLTSAP